MSQTKTGSFVEAWLNVAIGFGVNFAMNLIVFPALGVKGVGPAVAFHAGLIFTVVSVCRSYLVRRLFNHMRAWNAAD